MQYWLSLLLFCALFCQSVTVLANPIQDYLQTVEQKIEHLDGSDREMAEELDSVYQRLFWLTNEEYDKADILNHADEIIQEIFYLRIRLKDKLEQLHNVGRLGSLTEEKARFVIRAARYAEEMIGEAKLAEQGDLVVEEGYKPGIAFEGSSPELMVNPQYNNFEFQSGDVVLMRGSRHNSAAIARIGNNDSQFSHLAIVHIDEKTGDRFLVEALIETGLVITPLDEAMNHGVGRMVLYRYNGTDSNLPGLASKMLYEVADQARKEGRRIDYNFSMLMDSNERLFCSQAVRYAFAMASNNELVLPHYPSEMTMRNRSFFDAIGVKAEQTFAPGDIEVEPFFDVVAEWRDFQVTADLRLKDMVLDKIFSWMERDGAAFKSDFKIRAMARLAKAGSYTPGIRLLITKAFGEIPDYMTTEIIGTMIMLHMTAEPLYQVLYDFDQATIKNTGAPAHPRALLELLEQEYNRLTKNGGAAHYLKPGVVPAKSGQCSENLSDGDK